MVNEYRIKEASVSLKNSGELTVFYPQVKVNTVEMERSGIFGRKKPKEVIEWHSFYRYAGFGTIHAFLINVDNDYSLIKATSIDEAKDYVKQYESQQIEQTKKTYTNKMFMWNVDNQFVKIHPLTSDEISSHISGIKTNELPPSFDLKNAAAVDCLKELIDVYHNTDVDGQPKSSHMYMVELWRKAKAIVQSYETIKLTVNDQTH